jgi:hypothetical protein
MGSLCLHHRAGNRVHLEAEEKPLSLFRAITEVRESYIN